MVCRNKQEKLENYICVSQQYPLCQDFLPQSIGFISQALARILRTATFCFTEISFVSSETLTWKKGFWIYQVFTQVLVDKTRTQGYFLFDDTHLRREKVCAFQKMQKWIIHKSFFDTISYRRSGRCSEIFCDVVVTNSLEKKPN